MKTKYYKCDICGAVWNFKTDECPKCKQDFLGAAEYSEASMGQIFNNSAEVIKTPPITAITMVLRNSWVFVALFILLIAQVAYIAIMLTLKLSGKV